MPAPFESRAPRATDIPELAAIADATLFPGEMLEGMLRPALSGGEDIWRVVIRDGHVLGFAMAQPEEMTDRTWNLRAIATAPDAQGQGAGSVLLQEMERALAGQRLLIIDTTQLPEQARARRFYAARGYRQVSVIPAFFGPDEDKVTFVKELGA